MTGDVIKSFLVGLGFGVDDASLSKFNKAIASATLKVTALYTSVNAAAAGIVFAVSKISESFEQMGYEMHLIAPAINKAIILRQELFKAYSSAGINIVRAAQASVRLNLSLEKTKIVLGAIYKSVGVRFFDLLRKQSDLFRLKLYQNMPKIQNALERFVKFVFKALEAVTQLGSRLWSILTRIYDFFVMLDKATDGWSTIIFGVIAAWKLLNLSFLATPLGMLLAGFVALLALWDDFKTFKEGGASLIDWGSDAVKTIVGIVAAVTAVSAAVYAVVLALRAWAAIQAIVNAVMLLNPIGLIVAGVIALTAAIATLILKWKTFKEEGILGAFKSLGGDVLGFLGGGNVGTNLQNNPVGKPVGNPVGPGANNTKTCSNKRRSTSWARATRTPSVKPSPASSRE